MIDIIPITAGFDISNVIIIAVITTVNILIVVITIISVLHTYCYEHHFKNDT